MTRRLIEEELPLKQVNAESAREKSLRHGHISTMHLWWARRPLAMSRAVVFGTLLPDPADDAERHKILDLLALASPFEASTNPARIGPLRELIARAYPGGPPKVLDCFAGGGAIPLEALRLGCDTTAVDLNPVAYLIQMGEFHAHTFPRQAIAMVWDYVEIDPFQDISGSWGGAVRWIELVIRNCSAAGDNPARVQRGDAQNLPFPDGSFDAVIVDPPYYDAIQYGDLSDFFYVWLKRSVGHLHPGVLGTPLTPKQQEIIESRADPRSPEYISHEEFERRLQRALGEMARVVRHDGVVTIVFAHTDVEAWERLLRALRSAGLVVTTSWPMRSERAARSTALISAVLGSSVVLVCRPRAAEGEGFYDDVVRDLEQRIAERLDAFEEMGLAGADYFISAIGPAFEVFARYSRIVKLSGEEVDVSDLMVLARQAVARHAMRRLLGSESLAALDPESLFYLTWRWAYLTASIPADEAYKLERAFDVDLGHLCGPRGFARQSGSSFTLLGPQDRKGIKLTASPPLIDVLHLACQLWDAGRRRELEGVLGTTGMGAEPGFWSMARAVAEILPDGDRERTMLLGLTGNRDALAQAAARAVVTEPTLFDLESS